MKAHVYCHRKCGPQPKPGLCNNTLTERRIRGPNEDDSRPSLKRQ